MKTETVDLISVDLDGNDLHICRASNYMLFHSYGHKTGLRTLEVLLQTRFPPQQP